MVRNYFEIVCMLALGLLGSAKALAFTQYTTGTLEVTPSILYVAANPVQKATFKVTINGSVVGGGTGDAVLYCVRGGTGTAVATIPINNTSKIGVVEISVSSAPFNNEPGDYAFFARIPWETPSGGFYDTSPYLTVSVKVNIIAEHWSQWWFNGVNPDASFGYSTHNDLIANGLNGGYYKWEIDAGSSYARWSDGSIVIYRTSNDGVTLVSTNASVDNNDVRVYVYWKKTAGDTYYRCGAYNATIFSPNGLLKWQETTYTFRDEMARPVGIQSTIFYYIKDQFSTTLPAIIPWNENFTGATITDYPGENWGWSPAEGWNEDPSNARDTITRYGIPFGTMNPAVTVYPQTPAVPVNHRPGEWNVGSTTVGSGRMVKTLTWEIYRDHAAHNP